MAICVQKFGLERGEANPLHCNFSLESATNCFQTQLPCFLSHNIKAGLVPGTTDIPGSLALLDNLIPVFSLRVIVLFYLKGV